MSYDSGVRHNGNMTTNLSKVFNNVLKTIYGLLVLVIMQTILFRYNKYFVELEKKLKIF
jgi:hypothetical protein